MKLMEIKKGGKKESVVHGDQGITDPVTIEFIIDAKDYNKLLQITDYYKWDVYEALSLFCKYSDELVAEMEYNFQTGKFTDPDEIEE